ncbi:hypothetical protein KSF_047010 [Reticulibacter mediterranei]|uniref:Uncharacterized protein n=1 Tax=Reticulibacter mediterranei TaxID=2778369 RepID=A0A8J3IJ74_9CHLR|nr:hypothetical protein [Reticulibacter mediterranei]GHO94653.1 hypothetical protein KSF_047010 [Reticulibacter mediterranei]
MKLTHESIEKKTEEKQTQGIESLTPKEFTFDLEELDGNRAMVLVSACAVGFASVACASCSAA